MQIHEYYIMMLKLVAGAAKPSNGLPVEYTFAHVWIHLWFNLLACQLRVTIGDSGLYV